MRENSIKHLIIAVGGIGVLFGGQIISTWYITTDKGILAWPFTLVGTILVIAGVCCCIGAMLCQMNRYKK